MPTMQTFGQWVTISWAPVKNLKLKTTIVHLRLARPLCFILLFTGVYFNFFYDGATQSVCSFPLPSLNLNSTIASFRFPLWRCNSVSLFFSLVKFKFKFNDCILSISLLILFQFTSKFTKETSSRWYDTLVKTNASNLSRIVQTKFYWDNKGIDLITNFE